MPGSRIGTDGAHVVCCSYGMLPGLPEARAAALAASTDVGLDSGICLACLSFVSIALDGGDPRDIARELRRMTPDIWHDGLSGVAIAAVRRARDRGVLDADVALADLEERGGRSVVARAIVRKLAEELSRRARTTARVETIARDRSLLAPPEWN
jgi:hypothetical protein